MTSQNQPSFTCPVCGMTSYHPQDIEHGYCGNCHGVTGREPGETLARIAANQRRYLQTRSRRKQWQLTMENERLFAQIGVAFPPMRTPGGLLGWWLRRT